MLFDATIWYHLLSFTMNVTLSIVGLGGIWSHPKDFFIILMVFHGSSRDDSVTLHLFRSAHALRALRSCRLFKGLRVLLSLGKALLGLQLEAVQSEHLLRRACEAFISSLLWATCLEKGDEYRIHFLSCFFQKWRPWFGFSFMPKDSTSLDCFPDLSINTVSFRNGILHPPGTARLWCFF